MKQSGFFRQAFSDEDGLGDIAYVSLGAVMLTAIVVIVFLCAMVAADYLRCATNCSFNPLPLAQSVGLICAALFTTGLGGLTAYMVATRRRPDVLAPNQEKRP